MTESTTERVLRLLTLLQARAVWTGPELAERLGVTTRSVRRDVERLRALGYPVNATQGAGGGYQLGAGRALPPLLLDDEEAVAVAVSLRLAAGGTVAGASEAALRTLAKLDQVMPPRLRAEVRAIQDATELLPGAAVEIDGEVLQRLARACRDSVRVRFEYAAPGAAPTSRTVEPERLVATGRRWYLLAWDVDRNDWRVFRLDRMADVATTTWRFRARHHPDPAGHVQRAVSTSAYPVRARVRVHAPAERVRAVVPAAAATVTPVDDDSCLLETGAERADALAVQLGWVGATFEVLEPPALATAVAELADRLARSARQSGGAAPSRDPAGHPAARHDPCADPGARGVGRAGPTPG
ncbi:helix-turn-helix transcriptional regulator [Nocardioides caldifontis]|uniref:helix-turn-helix transcriptional regulator n=1 Tax=Nocardioides caldifontis TaxID=2588938 RepID=UPI0011DFEECE|nr:YafY family protein [Nocardioides caldifontis]